MRLLSITLLALAAAQAALAADNRAQQQQEEKREATQHRAAQAEVQAATAALRTAQQAFAAAQQKAEGAKSDLQKMSRLSRELHETLETRHADKSGVKAAREKLREAQAELDAVSQPVIATLKETNDYRSAAQAAMTARARLQELGAAASAEQRTALSQATLKPGELERAAIEVDQKAKAAKAKVTQANEAVRVAIERLNRIVEDDAEFKNSLGAVAKSQTAYNSAKAAADREERSLASAAGKLATERAQLVALERSQALDDMRDRQQQNRKNDKNQKKKK
jgi:hypothetical protein